MIKQNGCLNFSLFTGSKAEGTYTYTISSDTEKSDVIMSNSYDLAKLSTHKEFQLLKKGTYYLTIDVASEDTIVPSFSFDFNGLLCTSTSKTLKNNQTTVSAKSGNSDYHKFTLTKSAVINFQAELSSYYDSLKFTICDSKKKPIAKQYSPFYNDPSSKYFSLDKGTYYLKVNTDTPIYSMFYSAKAITEKSNSSSKPASLKVNTKTVGLITSKDGKNKTDYYKITTTKAGQLKGIYISYLGQGAIKISIKSPGMKEKTGTVNDGMGSEYSLSETLDSYGRTYYRDGKFPKGTYTIKVTKPNNTTSGVYEIATMPYK